jgi:hypothetical protein
MQVDKFTSQNTRRVGNRLSVDISGESAKAIDWKSLKPDVYFVSVQGLPFAKPYWEDVNGEAVPLTLEQQYAVFGEDIDQYYAKHVYTVVPKLSQDTIPEIPMEVWIDMKSNYILSSLSYSHTPQQTNTRKTVV